jgi:hypothetical protein
MKLKKASYLTQSRISAHKQSLAAIIVTPFSGKTSTQILVFVLDSVILFTITSLSLQVENYA